MAPKQRLIHALLYSLMLGSVSAAFGGPLAPCIKAVSSATGNFLVISNFDWEPLTKGTARRVIRVTLQVIPRERFINEMDRLDSPGAFWNDWTQWSVDLNLKTSPFSLGCPVSLITDDGEFLVVLGDCADYCLRIYERCDHPGSPLGHGPDKGVFVKNISLGDLWPANRVATDHAMTKTDESPQWFAGGSFRFSGNCREMIHKKRWGTVVRIRLIDGSITKN